MFYFQPHTALTESKAPKSGPLLLILVINTVVNDNLKRQVWDLQVHSQLDYNNQIPHLLLHQPHCSF